MFPQLLSLKTVRLGHLGSASVFLAVLISALPSRGLLLREKVERLQSVALGHFSSDWATSKDYQMLRCGEDGTPLPDSSLPVLPGESFPDPGSSLPLPQEMTTTLSQDSRESLTLTPPSLSLEQSSTCTLLLKHISPLGPAPRHAGATLPGACFHVYTGHLGRRAGLALVNLLQCLVCFSSTDVSTSPLEAEWLEQLIGTRLSGGVSRGSLCQELPHSPLLPSPGRLSGVHGTHICLQSARDRSNTASDPLRHSHQTETSRYVTSPLSWLTLKRLPCFSWETGLCIMQQFPPLVLPALLCYLHSLTPSPISLQ